MWFDGMDERKENRKLLCTFLEAIHPKLPARDGNQRFDFEPAWASDASDGPLYLESNGP